MDKVVSIAEFERLREDRDALANELAQLHRINQTVRDPAREQNVAMAILGHLPAGLRERVVVIVRTMQCGDLYATANITGCKRWVGFPQHGLKEATFARCVSGLIAGSLFAVDDAASVPPRAGGGRP